MSYKIKISCTSFQELCYNGKKISIKNYNQSNLEPLIINTDYINNALILYKIIKKRCHSITTKTLEFICNKEISDIEFKCFIQNMKDIGFNSKYDTNIQFIKLDNIHVPMLIYRFTTMTPPKKIKIKQLKNRSTYATQLLYTK